jgi:hypothetical protein
MSVAVAAAASPRWGTADRLGFTLAVPDHPIFSRRPETLDVPQLRSSTNVKGEPVHLLVDGFGFELCGVGSVQNVGRSSGQRQLLERIASWLE